MRASGGWKLSILQDVRHKATSQFYAEMQRVIRMLGRTTALKALDFGPKNLSEEFDPGSE